MPYELHRKSVGEAFWNAESEDELREANKINYQFQSQSAREDLMAEIDQKRANSTYLHSNCSEECRKRGTKFNSSQEDSVIARRISCMNCMQPLTFLGCGTLWSLDGNWKLSYPICMYNAPKEISGFSGQLNYVSTCSNQPENGQAFCRRVVASKGVPTTLKEYSKYKKKDKVTGLLV